MKFTLKAFGESDRPALDDFERLEVDGATIVPSYVDVRWEAEFLLEAGSEDAARALAEEIVSELKWQLGEDHGWALEAVAPVEETTRG